MGQGAVRKEKDDVREGGEKGEKDVRNDENYDLVAMEKDLEEVCESKEASEKLIKKDDQCRLRNGLKEA